MGGAIYALCEAEIFDSLLRHSAFGEGGLCHSDVEHARIHESCIYRDHCTNMWTGIIDGRGEKHLDYCRKVLEKVERESGGTFFYNLRDFKESMRTRPDGNMDAMGQEGLAAKYRTGCPDYYLPNEDGIRTISDVYLGVQDILDPDRLNSCLFTGIHEALDRGRYKARKQSG